MIIDVIVISVLLVSGIIAFLRGFIREVLTIAGVVGGMAAAYVGGPFLSPLMHTWLGVKEPKQGEEMERLFGILPYDVVADALAYGAVFIVVVIVLSIISHFLAETARKIGLGPVDRSLGFIFGLLRGVLLVGLLYLPAYLFIDKDTKDQYMKDSKTALYLDKTAEALAGLIPAETTEALGENVKTVQDGLSTREKLEQIDLLKEARDDEAKKSGTPATTTQPAAPAKESGYTDEFRDSMNRLFQDKTNTAPAPAPTPSAPANNGKTE